MRTIRLLFVITVFTNLLTITFAQETGTSCDHDEAQYLGQRINQLRVDTNQLPLVFDSTLCEIAQQHISDLVSRPVSQLGNIYESFDNSMLHDWLKQTDYASYSDGYNVNMFIYIARDVSIDFGSTGNMVDFLYNQEPLFRDLVNNNTYREFSVVYVSLNLSDITRYYYIFIFGAHPNILPIIPIISDTLTAERATTVSGNTPVINLLIHDERYRSHSSPEGDVIGSVRYVRTAQSDFDELPCPLSDENLANGWQEFIPTNIHPFSYTLSSLGYENINLQLCDEYGNSIISSTSVNYQPNIIPTLTPNSLTATEYFIKTATQQTTQIAEAIASETAIVERIEATIVAAITLTANASIPTSDATLVTLNQVEDNIIATRVAATVSAFPTPIAVLIRIPTVTPSSTPIQTLVPTQLGDTHVIDNPSPYILFTDNFAAIVSSLAVTIAVITGYFMLRQHNSSNEKIIERKSDQVSSSIFISYRHSVSADFAERVYASLSKIGFDVFIDRRDLTYGDFNANLRQAIQKRDVFILILTDGTLESTWVIQETKHAIAHNKKIIPVIHGEFDIYEASFPDEIVSVKKQQGVRFNQEYYEAGIDKLVRFIKK